jgi:uncharacterized glyoxalase superfamily protein PhnB
MKQAFGAEEMGVHHDADGRLAHALLKLGGSAIEMGKAHGRGPRSVEGCVNPSFQATMLIPWRRFVPA